MKLKTLIATLIMAGLTGCGPAPEETQGQAATTAEVVKEAIVVPAAETGSTSAVQVTPEMVELAAFEKSLAKLGCFACHAVAERRIGPDYRSIAERYRGQAVVDTLVNKIIVGGGGTWGPLPMTSHPHLTPEILTPLVEQILQLPGS